MPVQQIGSPQRTNANNTTSLTFSFTTSAGNHPYLLVAASHRDTRFSGSVVSGVTFGGTPLTFVGEETSTGFRDVYTSFWGLVNPTIQTANIVVTYNLSVIRAKATAVQFLFVDPVTPITDSNVAGGYGQEAVVSLVPDTGDLVVDSIAGFSNSEWTPSAANGQSFIDDFQTSGTLRLYTGISKKSTGSFTEMKWTKNTGGSRE